MKCVDYIMPKCVLFLQHFVKFLVDCMWSSWEAWSTCSKSCGGGKRSSKRTSNQLSQRDHPSNATTEGNDDCPTEDTREEECNADPCPGIHLSSLRIENVFLNLCNTIPNHLKMEIIFTSGL